MVLTEIISSEKVSVLFELDEGCLMIKDRDLNRDIKLCFDKYGNFELFVNGASEGTATNTEFISKIIPREPTEEEKKLKEKLFSLIKQEKNFITYFIFELFRLYLQIKQ